VASRHFPDLPVHQGTACPVANLRAGAVAVVQTAPWCVRGACDVMSMHLPVPGRSRCGDGPGLGGWVPFSRRAARRAVGAGPARDCPRTWRVAVDRPGARGGRWGDRPRHSAEPAQALITTLLQRLPNSGDQRPARLGGVSGRSPHRHHAHRADPRYCAKCVDIAGGNKHQRHGGAALRLQRHHAQTWTVATNGSVQALGSAWTSRRQGHANGTKVQLYDCKRHRLAGVATGTAGSLVNPQSGSVWTPPATARPTGPACRSGRARVGATQSWTLPS